MEITIFLRKIIYNPLKKIKEIAISNGIDSFSKKKKKKKKPIFFLLIFFQTYK